MSAQDDLDKAGNRYSAARGEWQLARAAVADAIRAARTANPAVSIAELARRSGLERQAVYEVLGMKVRGGGRSRPHARTQVAATTHQREEQEESVQVEPFEEAP